MYTNARSIEAEQKVCSKTPTPEIGLQHLRAYSLRYGPYPILERLVDVCS